MEASAASPTTTSDTTTTGEPGPERWLEALSRGEIQDLVKHRDLLSWLSVAIDWGIVFAAMALVAVWPNPLTIVLALLLIGTRQLGLAILMHDAAHRALFRNRALNDWVGNWLCAYPVWTDLKPYRPYHLKHHAKNYTAEDPDLGLVKPFPVTRASLQRKFVRDLTGQTGWKRAKATLRRDLGLSKGNQSRTFGGVENLFGVGLTNVILFLVLLAVRHPLLYLLWVAAWLTTFQLVTRIRAIAEHAMAPDPSDPLRNTRTTLVRLWERVLIAPNGVNYHLEHHLLMTVPHYNLPRLHRLLRDRGVLDGAWIAHSYFGVLRNASARAA